MIVLRTEVCKLSMVSENLCNGETASGSALMCKCRDRYGLGRECEYEDVQSTRRFGRSSSGRFKGSNG